MNQIKHETIQKRKWTFEAYSPFQVENPSWFFSLLMFVFGLTTRITHKTMNETILPALEEASRFIQTEKLLKFFIGDMSGGQLLWKDSFLNLTVNEGLDDILDKYWKGSAYTAAHYVMLTDGTPSFAAGDTMASHAGWAEVTTYSESVRQTLTLGTVSSQSVDNSASKAAFSINGAATVGGGAISTDNTKGGTAGTLIGGAAFTGGDRTLADGDTLNVTVTITEASA